MQKLANVQTKMPVTLRDEGEMAAQEAGFDNLQHAIRFFVKSLSKGELVPTWRPATNVDRLKYLKELDLEVAELVVGDKQTVFEAQNPDELMRQLNEEDSED